MEGYEFIKKNFLFNVFENTKNSKVISKNKIKSDKDNTVSQEKIIYNDLKSISPLNNSNK